MNLVVAAGSLLGVALVVGFAYLLGLGGDRRIDAAQARALIDAHGFAASELIVDRAGFAALASNGKGQFLLVRRHGVHFVTEPLSPPLDARLDHRFLTIGSRRAVTLDLGEHASIWAARLRTLMP